MVASETFSNHVPKETGVTQFYRVCIPRCETEKSNKSSNDKLMNLKTASTKDIYQRNFVASIDQRNQTDYCLTPPAFYVIVLVLIAHSIAIVSLITYLACNHVPPHVRHVRRREQPFPKRDYSTQTVDLREQRRRCRHDVERQALPAVPQRAASDRSGNRGNVSLNPTTTSAFLHRAGQGVQRSGEQADARPDLHPSVQPGDPRPEVAVYATPDAGSWHPSDDSFDESTSESTAPEYVRVERRRKSSGT